ncbi:hypothetical protein DIPPA_21843 [Diplonema papillatum]|nr:hypothetical protein DIPPA_21843 [Diplonema papillatum]|eukprot:gene15869-24247_t
MGMLVKRYQYPFCVILENVRSARNVGHILKSSLLHGGGMVGLVGITTGGTNRKTMRASLGAEQCSRLFHANTGLGAIARAKCRYPGAVVAAVETTDRSVGSREFFERHRALKVRASDGVILVLGTEKRGVSPAVLAAADIHLHLPLFGSKESLNVSDCAAIITSQAHIAYRRQASFHPGIAHVLHCHHVELPELLPEYPIEYSKRPVNIYSDRFTDWANQRLDMCAHPIPYG